MAQEYINKDDTTFRSRRSGLLVVGLVLVALLSILLVTRNPIYLIGSLAVLISTLVFIKWPDIVTLVVIALIFSNAVSIANRFHGAPDAALYLLPALLGIPVFWHLVILRERLIFNTVSYLVLFLILVQLVGVVVSVNSSLAFWSLVSAFTEGYLLFFILTNVIRDQKMLARSVMVILLIGMLMGGLSLYQQITRSYDQQFLGFAQTGGAGFVTGEVNLQGDVTQARLSGPIGEKNRFAQIMLMIVPIGLFYFWGEKSNKIRWFALAAGAFSLIGAALAFSRGAAVAFVILVLVMGMMGFIDKKQFIIIVLLTFLVGFAFPQYLNRLDSIPEMIISVFEDDNDFSGADSATLGRLTEMLAARDVWLDHPVFGVGTGMFPYHFEEYQKDIGYKSIGGTREAHSLYLGIAAENGTLGLLAYLAIFGVVLWKLIKARNFWLAANQKKLAALSVGFFMAIVSYLATGIFLHLSYIRYLWLILSLAMALVNLADKDNKVRSHSRDW